MINMISTINITMVANLPNLRIIKAINQKKRVIIINMKMKILTKNNLIQHMFQKNMISSNKINKKIKYNNLIKPPLIIMTQLKSIMYLT